VNTHCEEQALKLTTMQRFFVRNVVVKSDQKFSVHLMISVQKKTGKNILNSFNHLP
jgi:hypothetical protein